MNRPVPDGDKMRWYVVVDKYCSDPSPQNNVWTVSRDPKNTGWETDCGYPGYGLTKAEATELADAANSAVKSKK